MISVTRILQRLFPAFAASRGACPPIAGRRSVSAPLRLLV
jgi:hypothetical protein